jgi:serine/threonine protein kinase
MSNVFEGINLLHTSGLVHHDIKPRNIVVKEEGGVYKIRLIDFGFSQNYENLKEHYKVDSPLSISYQQPYIYWPFYAFVFGLKRAQIADRSFARGYDIFYRDWLKLITKYGRGIPEDHYFSTPDKFYTYVDYSRETYKTIKKITENPDAYVSFAKNVDIYSFAITLSQLFYNMFRIKSIWDDYTGTTNIVVYNPDDDEFIPYNSDFGNTALNAWIRNFVETVVKPFYDLILEMCDYNTIEAPRDIMVYKTKYETVILPQIKAAIYDETGTKRREFVKYLNETVPLQFSANTSTPYELTPPPPVHITGRGVNASAAVNSPNLSPIPEEHNNNEAFF